MKTNIERCDDFVQELRRLEANDRLLDSFVQRYLELYQEMKDTTNEEEMKSLFKASYFVLQKNVYPIEGSHRTTENLELFRETNRRHNLYKLALVDVVSRCKDRNICLNEEITKYWLVDKTS